MPSSAGNAARFFLEQSSTPAQHHVLYRLDLQFEADAFEGKISNAARRMRMLI
jgi:hypothetical protein